MAATAPEGGSRLRQEGGRANGIVGVFVGVGIQPVLNVEALREELVEVPEGAWPLLVHRRRLTTARCRHFRGRVLPFAKLPGGFGQKPTSLKNRPPRYTELPGNLRGSIRSRYNSESRATALDSNSYREKSLSIRTRIESNCSRFQPVSRAHALDSNPYREQLLSIPTRIESKCSRFQTVSRASALDSTSNREHLLSIRGGNESTALDSRWNREQVLSIRVRIESGCSRFELASRATALDPNSYREHAARQEATLPRKGGGKTQGAPGGWP